MKKIFAIGLLSCAMMLAACNNNNKNKSEFPDSFSESDEQIVYSSFVKANLYEEEEQVGEEIDLNVKNAGSIVHFYGDTIYNSTYSANGLYVIKNDSGRIGFYSSIINNMVVECRFEPEWTIYNVYPSALFGFILNIRYEDNYITTDAFGNKLCDSAVTYVEDKIINQKPYLVLNNNEFNNEHLYEYDSTGKASSIYSLPQQEVTPEEDLYEGPSINDLYSEGRYDLEDYGYPGYSISVAETGYIVVFRYNEAISVFYVDINTYNLKGLVGKVLVFQRQMQTMDEAEKYSFIENGVKYHLDTLLVNFETGKKTLKSFPYVIEGMTPLKTTSDSSKRYSYIVFKTINDNALLTESIGRIIDEDFVLHDDVSGMAINSFIELSNGNLFNIVTKIIYNSSMTPITSLASCNPVYHDKIHIFTGTYEGLKGIINESGIVKGEFRYTNIYTTDCPGNNYIIVKNSNGAYRLNYSYGNVSFIGEDLTKIDNNFFKTSNNTFFTSDENVFQLDETYTASYTSISYLNAGKAYVLKGTKLLNNGEVVTKTVYYGDLNTGLVNEDIKGTEKTSSYYSGIDLEQAVRLNLGKNNIHTVYYGLSTYGYAKYYVEESGYYNFYHNYSSISVFKDCGEGYREAVQYDLNMGDSKGNDYYDKCVTCFLKSGVTYYVEITQNTEYQLRSLYLEQQNGSNSKYPLKLRTNSNSTTIRPYGENNFGDVYYISFNSESLYKYEVAIGYGYQGTNSIYQVTVNQQSVMSGQFTLGANKTVLIRVQFNRAVDENIPLVITKTFVSLQTGKNQENPYVLDYGYQYVSTSMSYDSAKPYYYLAFFAPYGGRYSFAFTFDKYLGESSTYTIYSTTGTSNSGYLSSSTLYPSVENVNIPENGYILFRVEILENGGEDTNLTSYEVNSYTGYSYENPSSWSSSWYINENEVPQFMRINNTYSFDCKAIYTYFVYNVAVSYIDSDEPHYVAPNQNTRMSIGSGDYVVLRAKGYSGYIEQSYNFIYDDAHLLGSGDNGVELYSGDVKYFTYTNTHDFSIVLSVTISESNPQDYFSYKYTYNTSSSYSVSTSYNNTYGSLSTGNITLEPGMKFHLVIYNPLSYDRYFNINVNVPRYNITSNNGWNDYGDYWQSYSNYSSPTMYIKVQEGGYVDFNYTLFSNNYYYARLYITINNNVVIAEELQEEGLQKTEHKVVYVDSGSIIFIQFATNYSNTGCYARVSFTFQ